MNDKMRIVEILDVTKVSLAKGWWLILECGHWFHWVNELPPKMDISFRCPYEHKE